MHIAIFNLVNSPGNVEKYSIEIAGLPANNGDQLGPTGGSLRNEGVPWWFIPMSHEVLCGESWAHVTRR